jgi:hypothetical protein
MAERRKTQGMEVCIKFKGFHDSSASRESLFADGIATFKNTLLRSGTAKYLEALLFGVQNCFSYNHLFVCDSKCIWGGKSF